VACVGLLAHAQYTAHKEDADHGQYNDSESDVADHRSPQLGCAATQRTYSWKMAILGF
jgi:hypothetical protein